MVRRDLAGRRFIRPDKKTPEEDNYITGMTEQERETHNGKRCVGIDPNKSDLIFCVSGDSKDQLRFRYTQNQRRKEMRLKKHRREHNQLIRNEYIEGKTVAKWIQEASRVDHKTLNFDRFLRYIDVKNTLDHALSEFYAKVMFRVQKLNAYSYRQKSETKMLQRFERKFGPPSTTVICYGDWSEKHHRRHHEPVKGVGFRKLFRDAGYSVFLIDEYGTSKRCSACHQHGILEKFMEVENPRPWRSGKILCHGLLKCQQCKRIWNRDVNAATNIWRIGSEFLAGRNRPDYLQPQPRSTTTTTTTSS
jgi:transposase